MYHRHHQLYLFWLCPLCICEEEENDDDDKEDCYICVDTEGAQPKQISLMMTMIHVLLVAGRDGMTTVMMYRRKRKTEWKEVVHCFFFFLLLLLMMLITIIGTNFDLFLIDWYKKNMGNGFWWNITVEYTAANNWCIVLTIFII